MKTFMSGILEFKAVECACGNIGPASLTRREARELAQDDGWSRLYHGHGTEIFRCPTCKTERNRNGNIKLNGTRIGLWIEKDLNDYLLIQSEERDMSLSAFVRIILREHMENHDSR